ncbi:hypothetical protein PYCC9005_001436 [Savitreella phatthalungensis]
MQDEREQSRKFVGALNLDAQADFRRRFQQRSESQQTILGSAALQTPTSLPLQSPALSYDMMSGMNLIPANLLTPGIPGYHNAHFNFGYGNPAVAAAAMAAAAAAAASAAQAAGSGMASAGHPQSPTSEHPYLNAGTSPLGSPSTQRAQYFPALAPAQASARTIYIGNLPEDVQIDEVVSLIKTGPLENVRVLPEKNCAFVSFIDVHGATLFHTDASMRKPVLRDCEIKVGWGKPSILPAAIAAAIHHHGATRNVYLGNLTPGTTQKELRDDLQPRFGPIDSIKIVSEKNIGFVHFCNIKDAIRCVAQLPLDPVWHGKRVNYGKDRCAYISKQQQTVQAQNQAILGTLSLAQMQGGAAGIYPQPASISSVATHEDPNFGNRTVYLGNIHPETTLEEICNVVRGGILHHIRYIPEKHICFVTFVDAQAAVAFVALSGMQGLVIHNRRLKIGWGKHSGPLPTSIALAVGAGASRNVYVGNIDEDVTEAQLHADFAEFGEIELVNTLREKSCAFINFTHLTSAIRAIEGIKQKPGYAQPSKIKINFGKDRCGNPSRKIPGMAPGQTMPSSPGAMTAAMAAAMGVGATYQPHHQQHQQAQRRDLDAQDAGQYFAGSYVDGDDAGYAPGGYVPQDALPDDLVGGLSRLQTSDSEERPIAAGAAS